jgi:hypothetical protein
MNDKHDSDALRAIMHSVDLDADSLRAIAAAQLAGEEWEHLLSAELKSLREAAVRNKEMVAGSAIFMAMLSENYEKDPVALMQLGLGILLDKPFLLLAPKDLKISKRLRRSADRVAIYDRNNLDTLKRATQKCLKDMVGQIEREEKREKR